MLLLAGCALDSDLNKQGEDPSFDTGSIDTPIDTDTDTTVPPDTGDTATSPPACEDQSFPATTVPIDDTCRGEPSTRSFTPVLEWVNTEPGDSYSTPVVGQLTDDDGDGVLTAADTPDIVVLANSGNLWAISGDGTTLWSAPVPDGVGSASIGDLDGDGFPEVVGASSTATVAVHGEDGSAYWTGEGVLEAFCGASSIADLDADGDPEVIVGGVILNGQTGALRGEGARGHGSGDGGNAAVSSVADIDRDGVQEVVVGNALYDADGNTLWFNGEYDGYTAVADFDGDPEGEIVVSGAGIVRLQDDDGTVLWSTAVGGSTSGPPTVADLDGDGEPEIGVAGTWIYTALDTDGTTLWANPIHDETSGFTGSSVFDFEGDGVAEIVYADENDLWVFDGATGAVKLLESAHSQVTCTEYPTVADVDNDGHAEIIYTSSRYLGTETGVRVLGDADDSWMPGRQVWNQHAYNITNVEDDGGIPAAPDANWDTYNTFRSGDVSGGLGVPGADVYPVILDVCGEECGEGRVTLWVTLANRGGADAEVPIPVAVYAETDAGDVLVYSDTWTDIVASGTQSASEQLEFEVVPPVYALRVEIDGGDCDATNDTASWNELVCY